MDLEGKVALVTGAGSGVGKATALGLAFQAAKSAFESKALLGRVCKPEDVRDAILGFIEGSDMVTGQVLVVDGGLGIAG